MSEADLPIDIHAHKLLDWLVSRRHVNKDWSSSLQKIRSMIVDALKDMPEDASISTLLSSGNQLNYYTCKQIVEILKQTEADSKNIFGYYSSQRMKDWQEVIKAYEKNNVYMAEIAQIINRNVAFEVPSMKKAIAKASAMCDDLNNKASNSVKRSTQLEQQFVASAEALGISGRNPRQELLEQLDQLPLLVDSIEKQIKSSDQIRDFYIDFVQASLDGSEDIKPLINPANLCPVIGYIVKNGNTTYYQYLHGVKPDIIELTVKTDNDSLAVNEDDVIDFGENGGETIDFGDEIASTGNGNGSSNGTSSDGFVHVNDFDIGSRKDSIESVEEAINWDIEVTSEPVEMTTESSGQVTSTDGQKVARGVEALTIIECNITRDKLLDELYELQSFLEQRFEHSTKSDQSTVTSILFMSCTKLTQLLQTSSSNIKSMSQQIASIISSLTSDRIKVLYLIRDNPKYIDNTIAKLTQKRNLAEKALATATKCEETIEKIVAESNEISSKIPPLILFTRKLEDQIASDISTKYKGRPVNIMAGSCIL